MAIVPETKYAGKITPASADYPYGEARNITLPGDGTGTPWEAGLVNDIFGFQQALLSAASIVPTGNPEKVGASQYLQSLQKLFSVVIDQPANMEASTLPAGTCALLKETYRAGIWVIRSGNFSAEVTNDPDQLRFIAAYNDATGATGAWEKRQFDELTPELFGAPANGTDDDTADITAAGAIGDVLCRGVYNTTFTEVPSYAYGNGKMVLTSPARTEWVDRVRKTDRKRVSPTGFAFVPNYGLRCTAPGSARHAIDVRQLFDADFSLLFGNAEFWVDPVNGNDADSGSFLAPVKTVKAAYQKASVGTIRLLPGVYTDRFFLEFTDNTTGGGTSARPIRIIAYDGVVIRAPGDQPNAMTWVIDGTFSTGTYSATPSGTETANAIVYHIGGEEIVLPYYATGADLASVSFGWHQEAGGKIHVKLSGTDVEARKADLEIMYSRGATIGISGASTYLENVTFRGDSQFDVVYDGSGNRGTLYHKNCKFEFLEGSNVHTEGARIYSQNTVSRNAQNSDGFNYYDQNFPAAGGQVTEAVEIDCVAHSNGVPINNLDAGDPSVPNRTWDGNRNKQGSSGHANSIICRINGEYYDNFGQNIADTGAGSKTWMIGSECKDVYAELWNIGVYDRGPGLWTEGDAFLDSVRSGGETVSFAFYNQSGTSKHVNCSYSGFNADQTLIAGAIEALDIEAPDA